jgi:hypothetical protein
MRRTSTRRAVALAAVAVLTGFGQNALAATKVVNYQPAGMHATSTYSGSCSAASSLSAQPDAYRCTARLHGSYDPCFAQAPGRVACPIDLVHDSGVELTVAQLPKRAASAAPSSRPWAMRLTQGQFCISARGYTGQHGYAYACGASACAAPTLAPLNTTYETNCVAIAGDAKRPRPFFVRTLWF